MIRTSFDGASGIASIVLARPEKRNALTPEMLTGVAGAVSTPAAGARAILFAGEGAAFCAGFDLTLCKDNPGALGDLLRELSRAVTALRRSALPVVCAAQGAAIAGGCALLAGADFVITDEGARLGYPVLRLGISPAVNAPFVRQGLGDGPARALLLGGGLVDGREAVRRGLVSECVEKPERVLERAREIARDLAAKPPIGIQATKRWMNELDGSMDDGVIAGALKGSLDLVGSAEQSERLAKLWSR